jgi:hypothetical protein
MLFELIRARLAALTVLLALLAPQLVAALSTSSDCQHKCCRTHRAGARSCCSRTKSKGPTIAAPSACAHGCHCLPGSNSQTTATTLTPNNHAAFTFSITAFTPAPLTGHTTKATSTSLYQRPPPSIS